jgi:hypothetical protein
MSYIQVTQREGEPIKSVMVKTRHGEPVKVIPHQDDPKNLYVTLRLGSAWVSIDNDQLRAITLAGLDILTALDKAVS